MSRRCKLIIGNLISHPCGQPAARDCAVCGNPTCRRHVSGSRPGTCLQCAGEHAPPVAPVTVTEEDMFDFTEDELAAFEPHRDRSLHEYDS